MPSRHAVRFVPLIAPTIVAIVLAGSATGKTPPSRTSINLGERRGPAGSPWVCHVQPIECGWGTPHPDYLTNGGDPSGTITSIRWSNWGEPVAVGLGKNPPSYPGGGYYAPVTIQLRAYDLGRCPDGTRAYRRLVVREPERPGATPGHWHAWFDPGGRIC